MQHLLLLPCPFPVVFNPKCVYEYINCAISPFPTKSTVPQTNSVYRLC